MKRLAVHATFGRLAIYATATLLCVMPGAAYADVFGPISLASAGRLAGTADVEQASYAENPAISADGRYIAFQGSIDGRTGVFRRDLQTGEIAIVAEGNAEAPSISENGRYVSFTTTARLDEENDTNSAPDVYVRDMEDLDSQPCGREWEQQREACAFTLASAVNGSPKGLQYEYSSPENSLERVIEESHYGALVAVRSALSANGQRVAFITTAISNLAGEKTPRLQVAVRDLQTKRTELVSVAYHDGEETDEPIPTSPGGYGAVYPGSSSTPSFGESPYAGASISGDGDTVAWMGQNISAQAPVLSGSDPATRANYTEPLWRRVGEGPQSPTRRVTGGSDPSSPQCQASGETQLPQQPTLLDPCQGPFEGTGGQGSSEAGLWEGGAEADFVPQLNADGTIVAFLATARWIAGGEEFKAAEGSSDLYVVNMSDGLTRVAATRRLTELAGGISSDVARVAPIVDLGISPDGNQVAFSTERTVFPLGSPALVTPPAAEVGMIDLYDVDLADETLTRVTRGYEGQPSEAPAGVTGFTGSPSFSKDGDLLAFSSNADNLVYGEGNKAGNAFLVERQQFASQPTPQEISSPPASPALDPSWELGVTALSQGNGSVLLEVEVPGGGDLRAEAQSAVRVYSARVGRDSRRHGRPRATVATRTVAARSARAGAGGLTTLTLKLSRAYSVLARERGGLSATIDLTFSAPGHKTLRQSIVATFVRQSRSRRARRAAAASRRGATRGHSR